MSRGCARTCSARWSNTRAASPATWRGPGKAIPNVRPRTPRRCAKRCPEKACSAWATRPGGRQRVALETAGRVGRAGGQRPRGSAATPTPWPRRSRRRRLPGGAWSAWSCAGGGCAVPSGRASPKPGGSTAGTVPLPCKPVPADGLDNAEDVGDGLRLHLHLRGRYRRNHSRTAATATADGGIITARGQLPRNDRAAPVVTTRWAGKPANYVISTILPMFACSPLALNLWLTARRYAGLGQGLALWEAHRRAGVAGPSRAWMWW